MKQQDRLMGGDFAMFVKLKNHETMLLVVAVDLTRKVCCRFVNLI